jgi:hypothetical protein
LLFKDVFKSCLLSQVIAVFFDLSRPMKSQVLRKGSGMLSRVMSGCVGLILGMVILGSCTGDTAALSLVDSEGKPCQPLVDFFEVLHTQAPEIFEDQKLPTTLADMNGWAQNNLLSTAQGVGVMKENCQPILSPERPLIEQRLQLRQQHCQPRPLP